MTKRAHNFKDLTGIKYGRLLVKEYAYTNNDRKACWYCICDCGNEAVVSGKRLRTNHTKSCGCYKIEKRIEANKSENNPMYGKYGEKNHFYGKKHSEEFRDKMSKANKGKFIGKNSPCWNSNKTDEERKDQRKYPEYYEWRKAVYTRDCWTCQKCNDDTGGNLAIYHIESYTTNKELRTTLENGITLCKRCHKDFHHQYGYGENSRLQLTEFMGGNN